MTNNESVNLGLPQIFKNPNAMQNYDFAPGHLDVYIYLYLLYKNETENITLDDLINQKKLPETIQNVFVTFKKQGKAFSAFNFNEFTTYEIENIFTKVTVSNKDVKEIIIQRLLLKSFDFNKNDRISFFSSSGIEFANDAAYLSKTIVDEYYFDERKYVYNFLRNDILGIQKSTYLINSSDLKISQENTKKNSQSKKYTKIFAIPPIYRKLTGKAILPQYESQINVTTEDNIQNQVQNLLENLDENGIAILLVSSSVFTRNYKVFHKFLIEQRYLTGVISLPKGIVRPTGTSTSLLIFKKSKKNKHIKFLELKNKTIDYIFEQSTQIIHDLEEAEGILYEYIGKNEDYDLTISKYTIFNPVRFLESIVIDMKNSLKPISLDQEAMIFRGLNLIQNSDLTEEPESHYKLINISDIDNNQIDEKKLKYINHDFVKKYFGQEKIILLKKFILLENDILISKTTSPIKIAFPPKSFCSLIATGNIYIIRLNPDSRINPKWLKAYLETNDTYKYLIKASNGGSLRVISKSVLDKMRISIEAEEDQLDFVKKLSEQEEKITELEQTLEILKKEKLRFIESHFIKTKKNSE